jgi:bacterial/archaeal transporter family-2 protein
VSPATAIAATVAVGGLIAFQPVVGSLLGKESGDVGAAFIGFAIGTVILFALVVAMGDVGRLGAVGNVPWYYLSGGLTGAALVTVSLVTVRTLGAGGVVAATILGQLSLSMVLDALGVLGLEKIGVTPARVLGLLLLMAGTYLLTR